LPTFSSSMFNVNGPLQISVDFSDVYGPTLHTHYANLLSHTNAIAVEGELGAKQNRVNLTLGHVFSSKNRIKITAERLSQKQAFDFYAGSVDEWVSQYAGGAEIQHSIGKGFFNNIAAGGYYAQSIGKDLDSVIYTDESGTEWVNYRHIAGANSTGGHVSLGLKPWKSSMVTVTGYYDSLHYNTQYSDVSAEDSSSMGYGVALEQYIASTLKATAEYSHRTLYNSMESSIQWFHNIRHSTAAIAASIGYIRNDYNDSNNDTPSENIYTLGLEYYFMPIRHGYTMPTFNFQSLTAWVSEPAVRMEKVMATVDQKKETAWLKWDGFLTYHSYSSSSEELSWHNNATSNVPHPSIVYLLSVREKNDEAKVVLNKADVTGQTSKLMTDLTPNTTYIAELTVQENSLSDKGHNFIPPVTGTLEFTTTKGGGNSLTLLPAQAKATSAVIEWKSPNRYKGDTVTYALELTNTSNGSEHECRDIRNTNDTHANVIMQYDTEKECHYSLEPNTPYDVTLSATSEHTTYASVKVKKLFTTAKESAYHLNSPTITGVTATSATIEWQPPARYEGDSVTYKLELTNTRDGSTHPYENISDPNDTQANVPIKFDTASDGYQLEPDTTYSVTLSAISEHAAYTSITENSLFTTKVLGAITWVSKEPITIQASGSDGENYYLTARWAATMKPVDTSDPIKYHYKVDEEYGRVENGIFTLYKRVTVENDTANESLDHFAVKKYLGEKGSSTLCDRLLHLVTVTVNAEDTKRVYSSPPESSASKSYD
jgi:Fibronectin type III domain